MGLNKDKLRYDATTPANCDSVAAFLHASNKLTSTDVSGKEGLDVNILNEIGVDIDGVYNVTTNADPDNMGLIGHTRAASPTDAEQTERITSGVIADDLPSANVHALDVASFLMGYDSGADQWDRVQIEGGSLNVNALGNAADDAVDSGNPLKIGSRTVDAALTEVSAAGDRADLLSDMYRRIYINDAPNVGMDFGQTDVTQTSAVLVAANSGRRRILVQNLGDEEIYVGGASVAVGDGIQIPCGASMEIPIGENVALHAVAPTGATVDTRYMQLA